MLHLPLVIFGGARCADLGEKHRFRLARGRYRNYFVIIVPKAERRRRIAGEFRTKDSLVRRESQLRGPTMLGHPFPNLLLSSKPDCHWSKRADD